MQELRSALSKKEVNSHLGINLDLGIVKEDLELSQASGKVSIERASVQLQVTSRIDYSNIDEAVPDTGSEAPVHGRARKLLETSAGDEGEVSENAVPTESTSGNNVTIRNFFLTKNGRILRFSKFFATHPAHTEGKYRARRLRLRRKRALTRPIVFLEDQAESFRKPPPTLTSTVPSMSLKPPSIYHQIMAALGNDLSERRSGGSGRQRHLQEAFDKRASKLEPDLSKEANPPGNSHLPDERKFRPIELLDWEENIVWDVVKTTPSSVKQLYAGVPPAGPSSGPGSRAGSASGPNSRPNTPMPSHASSVSNSLYALSTYRHQATSPTMPSVNLPGLLRSQSSSAGASGLLLSPTSVGSSRAATPSMHQIAPRSLAGRIINVEFASGSWTDQIMWDDDRVPDLWPPVNLQLPMSDPNLIFETVDISSFTEKVLKTEKLIQKRLKKLRYGVGSDGKALVITKYDKPLNDRFNLSNDKHYEAASRESPASGAPGARGRGATSRAIMSSSRLSVQHSVPALKLSLPFYKSFWTKAELRSWHRPKLDTTSLLKQTIRFEKLIRAKDSAGPSRRSSTGLLSNAKQLSLRDRSPDYVLLEYSEEYPLLMMNGGMATLLFHYYRKQHAKDIPTLPEPPYGTIKVLEPNEASPFWFFGDVRPGQTLAAIHNNLFRAPLLDHETPQTDFLACKFNLKGKSASKWFIKELPSCISVVGQVFPTAEVYGPHSRRHNLFCRARIQAFAYRLFRKDAKGAALMRGQAGATLSEESLPRLKISRIMAAFPQFSEGSLRKWLKEYADSVRTGHDSGTWRMRKDAPILTEEDIRALITPEMICQYESMLTGQQRLNDAGLMEAPEIETGLEDENSSMEVNESAEVRLAPWNLSANFINATMSRCTLQLHGIGDPSGRGEAFSFVKVPLKMSVGAKLAPIPEAPETTSGAKAIASTGKAAPSKMSSEQVTYRQEIVKIWDAQLQALGTSIPPEDEEEPQAAAAAADMEEAEAALEGASGDFSMFEERPIDDETGSMVSRSSASRTGGRRLVIRRIFRDTVSGGEREEMEEILDARLISAYLNQRRVWERKRRRREIAAAASAARAKKARPEGAAPRKSKPRPPSASRPKKEVNVRCGTCGQVGHMRTNRICPRYSEYEAQAAMETLPPGNDNHRSTLAGGEGGTELKISISKLLLSQVQQPSPQHESFQTVSPLPFAAVQPSGLKSRRRRGFDIDSLGPQQRQAYTRLTEYYMTLMGQLFAAEGSWPFHKPVSKTDYPHYYRIIAKPLDFTTIRSRIKRNFYDHPSSLLEDLRRVRDNCIQFNLMDHPFTTTIRGLYDMAVAELGKPEVTELEMTTFGSIRAPDQVGGDDLGPSDQPTDDDNVNVDL